MKIKYTLECIVEQPTTGLSAEELKLFYPNCFDPNGVFLSLMAATEDWNKNPESVFESENWTLIKVEIAS